MPKLKFVHVNKFGSGAFPVHSTLKFKYMRKTPFALSAEDTIAEFASSRVQGLSKKEVEARSEKYGLNEIPSQGPKPRYRILAGQLMDPIIYILTVAAILAFVFSDALEGMAIIVVILISVGIGFFMELQAIRSLEALRKLGQARIYVLRSGKKARVGVSELVPGDIVLLGTGDIVPADARLIEVENLSLKESALTGESIAVNKNTKTLPDKTPITDQTNMVFRGTMVLTGSGMAIVTATGAYTQLGIIQQMGMDTKKMDTPLEKKLNQLSKWLIVLTLCFALLIVVTGYFRGKDLLLMIETGVALAVAAIPEGLPVVATIALAQGMLRLSKKQVIIKKLEAVQTLGATDIICTDKTGTLTEDRMKVHTVLFEDKSMVVGEPWRFGHSDFLTDHPVFETMMKASILCNNATPSLDDGQTDSIELALMDFAVHMGYDPVTIKKEHPEKMELPFDAVRKFMATVNQGKENFQVFVKGAFESLVDSCDTIIEDGKRKPFNNVTDWDKKVNTLALQGLRTLAFAYKETESILKKENLFANLTFLGIMGFIDPARQDVRPTIGIYKKAGIRVLMITGDHPGTSQKIAQEVGLLESNVPRNKIVLGKDLENLENDDRENPSGLLEATVFARVTPKQKLDLITLYQKNGHIVGMIGDGINDVPALKKADIGIAMGIRGTEAAREVADVILKNDKFTAVELAIHQGRVVFQNIRQFVVYLLSCNLAEIISVGLAALLNLPSPLLPLQILFLNLVTDVFPALALGLGKGEADSMEQPPKNPKEPIMHRKDWYMTTIYGLCISLSVLGIVIYANFVLKLSPEIINNMAFYTLILAQLLNVFNMPKQKRSFFINEVTKNPWIWAALALSLTITIVVYNIPPTAKALSLEHFPLGLLGVTILFGLGSLVLAQLIKWLPGSLGMARSGEKNHTLV
ncbi:cation-translocating P-type ATPase [Ulvibacterium sp.]|uniref:cation-translocating P-type ATPase n=1 Tax=Ulvibacterium sp. TaxID=2665914 RepID=UPI003BAB9972